MIISYLSENLQKLNTIQINQFRIMSRTLLLKINMFLLKDAYVCTRPADRRGNVRVIGRHSEDEMST